MRILRPLKNNEIIDFESTDKSTGKVVQTIGSVIGNYKSFKKEYAEIEESFYLIEAMNRSKRLFVVTMKQVREILGTRKS